MVNIRRENSVGSPPRAWGQLPLNPPAQPLECRFTPTCVGTAPPSRMPRRLQRVHPHVRGDSVIGVTATPGHQGSPPRAWGQPLAPDQRPVPRRFTPTCVGTARRALQAPCPCLRVHPHVRGDSPVGLVDAEDAAGSPPRAWGQLVSGSQPASMADGSPPRAWGQLLSQGIRQSAPRRVHPHVRGDSCPWNSGQTRWEGSPVRGDSHSGPKAWFTPTCVGTAWKFVVRGVLPEPGVHPHVRGDSAGRM